MCRASTADILKPIACRRHGLVAASAGFRHSCGARVTSRDEGYPSRASMNRGMNDRADGVI